MEKRSNILITGGSGLVGTALKDKLMKYGYQNLFTPTSREFDLTSMEKTLKMFMLYKPDYVFHLAARVYGIMGNMNNKGLSFTDNILINTHTIDACRLFGVKKIVAMGSGCVYPYPPPHLPLKEDFIWLGYPHPSEDSYAIAKRSMLAQLNSYHESYGTQFAFVISGNLYGPNDKFDEEGGHVIPSLISKFYRSRKSKKDIMVWGNGSAQRDFLYSDDVAEALILIMNKIEGPVNMGSGNVYSIKNIVDVLSDLTGLNESVRWDSSKPNGQDYRAYDLTKLNQAGFSPKYDLKTGLEISWNWFLENVKNIRK